MLWETKPVFIISMAKDLDRPKFYPGSISDPFYTRTKYE